MELSRVEAADVVAAIKNDPTASESAVACWAGLVRNPNLWRVGTATCDLRKMAHSLKVHEGQFVTDIIKAYYGAADIHSQVGATWVVLAKYDRRRDSSNVPSTGSPGYAFTVTRMTDALVVLGEWIASWNERADRRAAKRAAMVEGLDS